MTDEREYPGEYFCTGCDERWPVDDYRIGGALDAARSHAAGCDGDAEARYDPGLTVEDYDVDFAQVDG